MHSPTVSKLHQRLDWRRHPSSLPTLTFIANFPLLSTFYRTMKVARFTALSLSVSLLSLSIFTAHAVAQVDENDYPGYGFTANSEPALYRVATDKMLDFMTCPCDYKGIVFDEGYACESS